MRYPKPASTRATFGQGQDALIIPPHIQNQLFDLPCIKIPYNLPLPLHLLLPLPLSEKPSHAAIERPLSSDRPAEDDGVPGEETMLC